MYDYESERRCDAHVATFLDCIDAVKNVTPEGFAAIKVRTTVPSIPAGPTLIHTHTSLNTKMTN